MTTGVVLYQTPRLTISESGFSAAEFLSTEKAIRFLGAERGSREEPLWQRSKRRFRPFGRIFHEKCGLGCCRFRLPSNVTCGYLGKVIYGNFCGCRFTEAIGRS